MKKIPLLLLCAGMYFFGANDLIAQQTPQKQAILQEEAEEGPALFKFEPDYLASEEARRKEILLMRTLIDSMDISEGKR